MAYKKALDWCKKIWIM